MVASWETPIGTLTRARLLTSGSTLYCSIELYWRGAARSWRGAIAGLRFACGVCRVRGASVAWHGATGRHGDRTADQYVGVECKLSAGSRVRALPGCALERAEMCYPCMCVQKSQPEKMGRPTARS